MTRAPHTQPGRASPTDPATDRAGPPSLCNLTAVLTIVEILLTYGRHLVDTFERRAAAPGFHLLARPFGTANTAIILAHIRRGILRAAALQQMLLDRAARGRDLVIPPLRIRLARGLKAATQAEAAAPPEPTPAPSPSRRAGGPEGRHDPFDDLRQPSPEALKAEMRNRPIGRILGDICADLGVAPVLCRAPFWNALYLAMTQYDGSPATYELRRWHRKQRFDAEQDRRPTLDVYWPEVTGPARPDVLLVLGFFLGDEPVEPPLILPQPDAPRPPAVPQAAFASQAAAAVPEATGPP